MLPKISDVSVCVCVTNVAQKSHKATVNFFLKNPSGHLEDALFKPLEKHVL